MFHSVTDVKPGSDVIKLYFGFITLKEDEFNWDKIGSRETC